MSLNDEMSLNDKKQELRQAAKEKRHAAADAAGPDAAAKMAANYFRAASGFGSPETSAISGYWPMADELDVRPLLERLDREGRALALPVVVAKGEPLIFRRWRPGMALDEGGFGTRHPGPAAPELTPAILLVPLLAFDGRGHRLGWGGGFYDRTLAQLRARGPVVAVGVAFHGQHMDRIPDTPGDEPVDWVITEEDVLEIG